MKVHLFFKFAGMIAGVFGAIMIVLGIVGFFAGTVFSVQHYSNFLWFSIPFLLFGIFGMLVYIACKDKEKD
jgi:putative Mn2+ efflux pump MntP